MDVAIIGGGVAGLSAAHELVKLGVKVTIYEKRSINGGKARSMPVPNSGVGGRADLPGEHGYRFFPGFYKHLDDTLSEIPFKSGFVIDNLVPTRINLLARMSGKNAPTITHFPKSRIELRYLLNFLLMDEFGVPADDMAFFANKVWQFLTSCHKRRNTEYEQLGVWEYLDADNRSKEFREMFVEQMRSLVAADPRKISMKTAGNVFLRLFQDILNPLSVGSDRLLNGPTNDVWIDPWVEYLTDKGVVFISETEVTGINHNEDQITSIDAQSGNQQISITADQYILAVPVEVADRVVPSSMRTIDPNLRGLSKLTEHTEWMNGMQLYLTKELTEYAGHILVVDSPWAISYISQLPFWNDFRIGSYGDGSIKGILSVDISDWGREGTLIKKQAKNCTPEEIKQEVWYQLKASLNKETIVLEDNDMHSWFLDPDITKDDLVRSYYTNKNAEPLLVNVAGSWKLRPTPNTAFSNFYLAADYVRTNTDLATMEAANEAAKQAVTELAKNSGLPAAAKLYKMEEPLWLKTFQAYDERRYTQGKSWKGYYPLTARITGLGRSLLRPFVSRV